MAKVTKDMIIADILKLDRGTVPILLNRSTALRRWFPLSCSTMKNMTAAAILRD